MVMVLGVCGVLAAAPARAQSEFSFGVHGGGAIPLGTFGDGYQSGFSIGADADLWFVPTVAVGLDVLYSQHDAKSGNATGQQNVSLLPVGGHLKLAFSPEAAMVTPWVQVGAGAYNIRAKDEDIFGEVVTTDTRFGMNVGAGLDLRASPSVSVGAVGLFHVIPDALESDTGSNAASYVTLGLRISFTTAGTSTIGGRPYDR
jgi:opacity protein-like surface antigen